MIVAKPTPINWNDIRVFKTWNYKYIKENAGQIIIDSLAVLMGNYEISRKQAALLLLKTFLKESVLNPLLDNKTIYPYSRNDYRVKKWTKEVLSRGYCEACGSTEQLEAHHIIKWADFPQGRIDVSNGMCLCHDCHTEEHKEDQSFYMMKAKNS